MFLQPCFGDDDDELWNWHEGTDSYGKISMDGE